MPMYRFAGGLALILGAMAAMALAQPQLMPIPPQFGAPAPSPGAPGGSRAPSPAPAPAHPAGGNFADEMADFGVQPQTELQSKACPRASGGRHDVTPAQAGVQATAGPVDLVYATANCSHIRWFLQRNLYH